MSISNCGWILVIVFMFAAVSCAPSEKTQQEEEKKNETEKEISIRPTWFVEANRKTSGSLKAFGYGMAVSYDSSKSLKQAVLQAETHLKNTIGDSLEKIRKSLIKSDTNQGSYLEDPSFLINLRNAVGDLTSRAKVAHAEVRTKKSRYIGFARVAVDWSSIKRHLGDKLSEHAQFLKAL